MGTENAAYVIQPAKATEILLDGSDKYEQAGRLLSKHGWGITGGSPPVGLGATYTKHVRFPGRKDLNFKCLARLNSDHVHFYNIHFGIEFPAVPYGELEKLLKSWAEEDIQFQVSVEPTKKPYRVVDLQDRPLGEGTLTEVQEIFKERYPHFDAKHIQHFIYEQ